MASLANEGSPAISTPIASAAALSCMCPNATYGCRTFYCKIALRFPVPLIHLKPDLPNEMSRSCASALLAVGGDTFRRVLLAGGDRFICSELVSTPNIFWTGSSFLAYLVL